MHDSQTGIILLAAGASTRMGRPKQLMEIDGIPMLRRAAQAGLGTGCRPVVVVLGANESAVRQGLIGLDVKLALNTSWKEGMSSSIRCGVATLLEQAPNVTGLLLMPGDQPDVSSATLQKILKQQKSKHHPLVAARYGTVIGTPAYFSKSYFSELQSLCGQGGAKFLLERHRSQLATIDLPEAKLDLDTPEDFAAFIRHHPDAFRNQTNRIDARRDVMQKPTHAMDHIEPSSPPEQLPGTFEATGPAQTRRQFITNVAAAGAGVVVAPTMIQPANAAQLVANQNQATAGGETFPVTLQVNGKTHELQLDPRVTLLDALREHLDLSGSKKGCDHGQCGACTVLVNGKRINSCLALAVVHEGDEITTIEGLANGENLHPVQAAFLEHDGFQCGYCTPGQICSAVACLQENHANSDDEIREWMSGNICRCGAYTNIVAAIRDAKAKATNGGAK